MFVGDKFYNIDTKRDFDVCLEENGFDPAEVYNNVFSFHVANRAYSIEGLIGDDLQEVEYAIQQECEDLRNEVKNLESRSCKGNTRADIAERISRILENIYDMSMANHIYDPNEL